MPMGSGRPCSEGVQVDVVAQDVALDRLDEGLAAAFQPFEQVGAAEAHQPLAGAGEIVEHALLRRCVGRLRRASAT